MFKITIGVDFPERKVDNVPALFPVERRLHRGDFVPSQTCTHVLANFNDSLGFLYFEPLLPRKETVGTPTVGHGNAAESPSLVHPATVAPLVQRVASRQSLPGVTREKPFKKGPGFN